MARKAGQTLSDRILDQLELGIFQGVFPPGAKLTEANLAKAFGISRGPLREAIRDLEGRRLVRRVPHVGAQVVALSDQDVSELFLIREALEGLACRLAAVVMSSGELDALEAVLNGQEQEGRRMDGQATYYRDLQDRDFHYLIAMGSKNQRLIDLLCRDLYYLVRLYRYRVDTTPGRSKQAMREHREILAALRARDSEQAEALMRAHVTGAHADLLRH